MVELVKVTREKHADLRVRQNCNIELAASQHVLSIRASEIAKAACAFPIFMSRSSADGDLTLSAVCGLEPGVNLFADDDQWNAVFQPGAMKTYPLFLMRDEDSEKGYAIGIDENSDAFSKAEGDRLFEENGGESLYLSNVTALLDASVEEDIQSFHFLKAVDELGLQKAVDIVVFYEDGETQTIKGLSTIDEDKLKDLSTEKLEDLNRKGYLIPMYGMLMSIYQLNQLIRHQSMREGLKSILRVKLELAKDATAEF